LQLFAHRLNRHTLIERDHHAVMLQATGNGAALLCAPFDFRIAREALGF
jgi:hypothetical protein